MNAAVKPEKQDALTNVLTEQRTSDGAHPITDRSLDRLRALLQEMHDVATSIRKGGPIDVRLEALNLVAGIRTVADLVQDLSTALSLADIQRQSTTGSIQ